MYGISKNRVYGSWVGLGCLILSFIGWLGVLCAFICAWAADVSGEFGPMIWFGRFFLVMTGLFWLHLLNVLAGLVVMVCQKLGEGVVDKRCIAGVIVSLLFVIPACLFYLWVQFT